METITIIIIFIINFNFKFINQLYLFNNLVIIKSTNYHF